MQPLAPGDPATVGRYRLGGRLGHGGMGQVYWGRSPSGRPVAIKVVHPHLAGQPDFRRRFAQEVDAARRVSGFHTAPVVDADPGGDPPWLVTAYVPGPSLAQAVQRAGPLPVPTLRVLGVGLAEALEAVHAAGLVHRDLKPANILLVDDGPRVIDFGIARALDPAEAQGLTGTGAAIGTPRFMAPEQFGDEPITGAADVFAWGSVICHAAGAHPYGEGSAATIIGAILTRPPRLDAVPVQLQEIVSTAMERDPARRPTPVQLIEALSDGTPSSGWLPPPVQAMLPEHTLPDTTSAGERTEVMPTAAIDVGRTARIAPPPHQQPVQQTRQFMGLPPEPAPEPLSPSSSLSSSPSVLPPPGARRRGSALTIGIAVGATLLVIVALIVGINLSGARPATPEAAAPASTAEATEEPPSESTPESTPDPTPDAAGDVTPESFLGNWQTVEGSDQNVAVSIDPLEEGTTSYGLSITIVDATACNGGSYKGTGTGSPSGNVLATSWAVACDTDTSFTDSFARTYTFDAATGQLTDDQGLVFGKQ